MIVFVEKNICLPLSTPDVYRDHALAKVDVSLKILNSVIRRLQMAVQDCGWLDVKPSQKLLSFDPVCRFVAKLFPLRYLWWNFVP